MSEILDILLSSFLLSIILLGIHSYYGLHIISRGIIFTDLAIGQMAALGVALSIVFFDSQYIYSISLIVALIGALMISISSRKILSHEAFIGLLYAFGISTAVIFLSKTPRGTEDFQKLLASDILFVNIREVLKTALIYIIIGGIVIFAVERTKGIWHELLFFSTFAFTVTSSVSLAGVLVVFAILVSPAFIMSIFFKSFKKKLFSAWIFGTIINLISILLSYFLDIPTGYTIVCLYSFCGIIVAILKPSNK